MVENKINQIGIKELEKLVYALESDRTEGSVANIVPINITPNIAEGILRRNGSNRHVRASQVSTFKNRMLEGRWSSNIGEALCWDKRGNLKNGQHRLLAIIESGCTVTLLVNLNPISEDEAFLLDSGTVRSLGDKFDADGVTRSDVVAPVIRLFPGLLGYKPITTRQGTSYIEPKEIALMLADDICVAVDTVNKWKSNRGVSVGARYYAIYFMLHLEYGDSINEVFNQVVGGVACVDGSRELKLRRELSGPRGRLLTAPQILEKFIPCIEKNVHIAKFGDRLKKRLSPKVVALCKEWSDKVTATHNSASSIKRKMIKKYSE